MLARYACFDELADRYIAIGVYSSDLYAHIATSEHGLDMDGAEFYVAPVSDYDILAAKLVLGERDAWEI